MAIKGPFFYFVIFFRKNNVKALFWRTIWPSVFLNEWEKPVYQKFRYSLYFFYLVGCLHYYCITVLVWNFCDYFKFENIPQYGFWPQIKDFARTKLEFYIKTVHYSSFTASAVQQYCLQHYLVPMTSPTYDVTNDSDIFSSVDSLTFGVGQKRNFMLWPVLYT